MHNIRTEIISAKTGATKKGRTLVQAKWDAVAARAGRMEGAHGLLSNIEWKDNLAPLDSVEAAEKWVEAYDRDHHYDYAQVAVRFKADTAKSKELREGLEKAKAALEQAKGVYYAADRVKSKYVSCKHCGSKLSTEYLKSNTCPLCHHDLRPEAVQNKQKRLETKVKTLKEKVEKAMEIMWLVKVEYHS